MSNMPLKPLTRGGSFLPTDSYTPLVYPGGKTTQDKSTNAGEIGGGEQNSKAEEVKDADR